MTAQNGPEWPNPQNQDLGQETQESVPEGLSDAQLTALEMILGGARDAAVAKQLNVGRRTVYRWRVEHPGFRQELEKRRQQLWEFGVDRFRNLTTLALDRLEAQIRDPYAPISMQAARHVVALAHLGTAAGGSDMPHQRSRLYGSVELEQIQEKG